MKLFLVTLLVAYASADVSHIVDREAKSVILQQDQDLTPEGNFNWSFDTDNGISAKVQGAQKNIQPDVSAQVIQGVFTYTAPDGQVISTQYTSDENGFVAQGAHIPTSPPIPDAILRGLEYIRLNPPKDVITGKVQN